MKDLSFAVPSEHVCNFEQTAPFSAGRWCQGTNGQPVDAVVRKRGARANVAPIKHNVMVIIDPRG
jgi:hypothetical protein